MPSTANGVVDWLVRYFAIAAVDRTVLQQARVLGWRDFEDAVVAVAAQRRHCQAIVTRNVADFPDSPFAAVTPEEYLMDWS